MAEKLLVEWRDMRPGGYMPIFQITRSGLAAIAILVVVLWGCLVAERMIIKQSRQETYRVMRDMRYLKIRRQIEPASAPAPVTPLRRLHSS